MSITDVGAIKFCNEMIRPSADDAARAYTKAKSLVNRWNALGMANTIPNDSTLIDDGASTDGRPQITGAQVWGIVLMAQSVVTQWEANSNQVLNCVMSVAVNPS
jgi:hypothetical protein